MGVNLKDHGWDEVAESATPDAHPISHPFPAHFPPIHTPLTGANDVSPNSHPFCTPFAPPAPGNGEVTDCQKVNCSTPFAPPTGDTPLTGINEYPLGIKPRTYEGVEYYGAEDVAKIIGVKRQTVMYWQKKGHFTADKRAHDGRYLYLVERVMQLKSVYRSDWNQPAYIAHVDVEKNVPKNIGDVDRETINYINSLSSVYMTNEFKISRVHNDVDGRPFPPTDWNMRCPFCGGHHLTNKVEDGYLHWFCDCFKGTFKTNFDIFAHFFGLNPQKDFWQVYKQTCEKLNREPKLYSDDTPIKQSSPPAKTGLFADAKDAPTPPVDEKTKRIAADLTRSREEFKNLPDNQKRGLRDETFTRLNIGFINRWVSPSAPNTIPTPRFICRAGDFNDPPAYDAVLTPDGRDRFKNSGKWEANKCLAAGTRYLFNPAALTNNLFLVTEGEIDAASIIQASNGQIAACALGGAGNFDDFEKRLAKLQNPPSIIVMFDRDSVSQTGQLYAPKLVSEINEMFIPAVAKFLEDVMTKDEIDVFADEKGKVDANQILQRGGDEALKTFLDRIIAAATPELECLAEKFKADRDAVKKSDDDNKILLPNRLVKKFKHRSSPQNISPKIQQLLEEVKNIPLSKEDIRGILPPARKSGIICPECGNGDGKDGTGAEIYTSPPGVYCHKCKNWHVDGFDLFAIKNGLNTTGKDFFTTLRAALDEYGINYDPKDFEPPKSAHPNIFAEDVPVEIPADNPPVDTVDPKIVEWQIVNGQIDPRLLPEIKSAANYLEELTVDELTAEIVRSPKTLRAFALCIFYNFTPVADKFLITIDEAIDVAKSQVKVAKECEGFVADPSLNIQMLAKIKSRDINDTARKLVSDIKKAHKAFQQQAKRELARAREQEKINARQIPDGYRLTQKQVDYLFSMDNTEYSNAERFLSLFGKLIRFNVTDEQWFRFDKAKGLWQAGGRKSNVILQPFVKQIAEILMQNAPNPVDNPDSVDIINGWKSLKKTQLAINYMKSTTSIIIKPSDLDRHKNLLNCINGVLDLQTSKFYETKAIDPAWLITKQCNAIWRGANFISDVVEKFFTTLIPDEETRRALISWFGYCLTGNVDQQIVHFWKGSGANGKSTLINFILDLFGSYGAKIPTAAILEQHNPSSADAATNALNPIEGARIAIFNELKRNDRLNGPLIKDLSGGDKFNLRPLFMNMREIYPTAKIVINGNYFPKADNINDDGLLRRIRTVEFTQVFKADEDPLSPNNRALQKPDIHLVETLATPEALSALLARLVAAARDYYETGTVLVSKAMTKSREGYIAENDFIAEFVNEHCITDDGKPKSGAFVHGKDFIEALRNNFRRECAQFNDSELRALFQKRYPQFEYRKYGRGHVKSFVGIGLIDVKADIAESDRDGQKNNDSDFIVPPDV